MEKRTGTVELLALEVGRALESLETLFTPEEILAFFSDLGLEFGPDLLSQASFTNALNNARSAATTLVSTSGDLASAIEADDVAGAAQHAGEMINAIRALIVAIDNLATQINMLAATLSGVTPADVQAFAAGLTKRLLEYMLLTHLEGYYPLSLRILALLGLVDYVGVAGDPADPAKPPHTRKEFRLDRLANLIQDPGNAFEILYGWGTPAFDGDKLLSHIAELLFELDLMVGPETADSDDEVSELYLYWVRLASLTGGSGGLEAVLEFPVPDKHTASLPLLFDGWSLDLEARGALGEGLRVQLRPPAELTFIPPSPDSVEGSMSLQLVGAPEDPSRPFLLLGQADGSRLELTGVKAGFSADFIWNSPANRAEGGLMFEAGIDRGRLMLSPSGADGFLASILPSEGFQSEFDFRVKVSESGVHFEGSATLEIKLPVHVELGPIQLDGLYLIVSLQLGNNAIPVEVSTAITTQLGPLTAAVDRLGFLAEFSFPANGGNLGLLNLDLGFKPPTGISLSIDGGGFKGGGFLSFDPAEERYVGFLELELKETVELKAIGLLTTRLPGGEPGFSLLIIITAEFNPIQLGFGFTLNGVGGLLGLNRTMRIERLRTGIRDNTLSSILFPPDPVANANRIISDLRQVFPPQPDRFVFGPMGKIGWGTPTLITIDVGLALEMPDPVTLAILGVLKALLPDEEKKLLKLQVNFLGVVEFEKQQLSFDATIYDSKLLSFPLSGDMALRLSWGNNPNFLLTVGGFHPAYDPPPLALPPLRPLTLQLLQGKNPRLTLETYFAVTSNTVQFGAKLELYAGAGPFNVHGLLAFDALFQFSPFYFIAAISAMLALRRGSNSIASIKLALTLEGTTPWKVKGTATLKLCWFIKVKVRFNKTFGKSRDTRLDDVEVLPLLTAALRQARNWEARPPARRHLLVSLKEIDTTGDIIVAHPFGVLTVSQKVVPLNVRIDTFGHQQPRDGHEFRITDVTVEGKAQTPDAAQEYFAPAQFFEKSDAEKLSSKSFERYDSGIRLTKTEELESDHVVRREVEYELSYIDSQRNLLRRPTLIAPDLVAFNTWASRGAIAQSPLSQARTGKSALAPDAVRVAQEDYAVVTVSDLTPAAADPVRGSEAEALAYMQELIAQEPALGGQLQVVPTFELN